MHPTASYVLPKFGAPICPRRRYTKYRLAPPTLRITVQQPRLVSQLCAIAIFSTSDVHTKSEAPSYRPRLCTKPILASTTLISNVHRVSGCLPRFLVVPRSDEFGVTESDLTLLGLVTHGLRGIGDSPGRLTSIWTSRARAGLDPALAPHDRQIHSADVRSTAPRNLEASTHARRDETGPLRAEPRGQRMARQHARPPPTDAAGVDSTRDDINAPGTRPRGLPSATRDRRLRTRRSRL
ncbi:hypothetical protein EXIGLDRAFT_784270 [Exidia glandulosa HHB12029]|uniref:Uncharacterized protein n=1 Tax=Exidia glandulosa HHB12029 TaxID=1314781 RepID=A0A166MKA3_EXIGL|nr:hypothetical protein EXIGLDRAFT_784270 [Exidia glandulosa HHB12029]